MKRFDVGDMLDDFHGKHHVEALAGFGQRFRGGAAIVNRETGLCGMVCRRGDVFLDRIGADHRGAEPCQRLG